VPGCRGRVGAAVGGSERSTLQHPFRVEGGTAASSGSVASAGWGVCSDRRQEDGGLQEQRGDSPPCAEGATGPQGARRCLAATCLGEQPPAHGAWRELPWVRGLPRRSGSVSAPAEVPLSLMVLGWGCPAPRGELFVLEKQVTR